MYIHKVVVPHTQHDVVYRMHSTDVLSGQTTGMRCRQFSESLCHVLTLRTRTPPGFSMVSFVALTNLIYSGKHIDHPKTRTFRCSTFEIATDGESVELDGEVVQGPTPQFWRVVPRAIRFIS